MIVVLTMSLAACGDSDSDNAGQVANASNDPQSGQAIAPESDPDDSLLNEQPDFGNIVAANEQPWIFGEPVATAGAGQLYSFVPWARDLDGDEISFSIENLPSWASFNETTGRLSGLPAIEDLGLYSGISISVTDGQSTNYLQPFDIEVEQPIVATRQQYPGHYISMVRTDDQNDMVDSLRPGVAGIQKRWHWRQLEPSFDNYDFSEVESDLDLMAANGARLIVFVEEKTFTNVIPTPPYLHDEYTAPNKPGGYTSIRWDPYVVERFKKLLAKLGERFDTHPAFEGVAIQESSPGFSGATLDAYGYTPEKYRDAIIDVLTSAGADMPSSSVFWYMNFFPRGMSNLPVIARAVADYNVVVGGPDVLPDDWSLVTHAYPLYEELNGTVQLFNSMQYNSFNHVHDDPSYPTKYWTMDELYNFAVEELHVEYLFWNRKTWRRPSDSYIWEDALPIIANNPSFNQ